MSIERVIASVEPDTLHAVDRDMILNRVAEIGNLSQACRELGVNKSTFLNWCDGDKQLADRYAQARARGIDAMMEELLNAPIEDAAISRLEWDRKRWHASKLFAKRYGDKVEHEHSGDVNIKHVLLEERRKRAGMIEIEVLPDDPR